MSTRPEFESFFDQFNKNSPVDRITKDISVQEVINRKNDDIEKKEAKQKLKLRKKSFDLIARLIFGQLLFSDFFILIIVLGIILDLPFIKDFDSDIFFKLIDFLKYFIGATIVEMLGMLFFVIKFLFSNNVLDNDTT